MKNMLFNPEFAVAIYCKFWVKDEMSFKTGNLIDFGGAYANRKIIERGTC